MKQTLLVFARRLDAFCAKLNHGLVVVALLLGFLVITMSVIRAQETMPYLFDPAPASFESPVGY